LRELCRLVSCLLATRSSREEEQPYPCGWRWRAVGGGSLRERTSLG